MPQLTDRKIQSLKPTGKPFDVKDTQVPGLHVRVMPTGSRSFVLLTRYPGSNNPTRRALGVYGGDLTLEEARAKATDWRKLIRKGIDPSVQEERERQAALRQQQVTFGAAAEDFIKTKLPAERKGWEVEQDIRRELMPRWGKRPIADITPIDVRTTIRAVVDRGSPYAAHNLLVLARRLFEWACDQQSYGIEVNPCSRLKPKAIVGKRNPRKRVLSDDELRAFWRASERLGYPYGPLFQMLALTGQRRSEVGEARWSEIDLAKKLLTIAAERMKADAAHLVPLSDDVIRILMELPQFKSGDFLFSTTFGRKPVRGFNRAKHKLDRLMLLSWRALGRIKSEDRRARQITPFVLHDIRRTMRTGLSALPIPDLIRELVIAHTKPGLHKVYDQFEHLEEKRRALNLWAARLHSIVEPPPPNVVELPARAS
jgi:integrase